MSKEPIAICDESSSKKAIILRAALKAYSTYGIDVATTRQIAELAGIGKSTIYEYFSNKDELLNAAFEFLVSGMTAGHKMIHETANQDPVAALNSYIDSAIETSLNEPSTLLLISQYSLGVLLKTNQFDTAKTAYQEKMHPVVQSLTEEFNFIINIGLERNIFKPVAGLSTESLVYTVCALIREIQAQAFLLDKAELANTCTVIKDTIFVLLGIKS